MAVDRIYMDSCCFIESVKSKFGDAQEDRANDLWYLQKLLNASKNGDIEVITSYLTIAECTHAKTTGNSEQSEEVKRLFRSILSSGKVVKLAQLTKVTAELARDLHWEHNINVKGADAIHLATAITTGCKEFLSFDSKKPKSPARFSAKLQSLGITVIEPASTQLLPGEYRQHDLGYEKDI
jgi:predicted nucleic acid-binding protein